MVETPSRGSDLPSALAHLCTLAIRAIPATGASVTLAGGAGATQLLCSTDDVAATIADLQFALGEGPALAALRRGQPVLIGSFDPGPDAPDHDASLTPALLEAAHRADVGSLFAFPLKVGAVHLGVLELYRTQHGDLGEASLARAYRLANGVTHTLLSVAGSTAAPADAAQAQPLTFDDVGLGGGSAHSRAVVHQATGMLMVQLGVPIDVAFARLRGHAFAAEASIMEIARSVVARSLRLEPDHDYPGDGGDEGNGNG